MEAQAEEAGILAGDIILEVDGESIEGLSLMEAVAKIRGPRGTIVRLLVLHLGAIDPIEIPVRRGVIPLTSVRLRSEEGDRFAHIRITDLYANTPEQLEQMLQEVIEGGAEGLILDIRTNPGGILNATIEVASEFLDEGLVMYSLDGDGNRIDYEVRRGGVARDIPMVVLINEFTASAPEIIAGALQDHGRATIIGATSFGKGSVNIPRGAQQRRRHLDHDPQVVHARWASHRRRRRSAGHRGHPPGPAEGRHHAAREGRLRSSS